MAAELPLSMRICLVLNPSIISMMTRGSSCGFFTPLASSSENRMSILVHLLYFKGISHEYCSQISVRIS